MNFSGHAFIARNHPHLIAGNFAGDSFKGNLDKFDHLPKNIMDGVRLHRFIDDYTDSSPYILKAGQLLQNQGIKKISFIATDIILDFHLTSKWEEYASSKYEDFVQMVYDNTDPYLEELDEEFNFLYSRLKKYGWMLDYTTEDGIQKILRQFSKRIRFENDLDKCFAIYKSDQKTFDQHFKNFLVDIEAASIEFISAL
jgi:acyl carrier protein phosphodiesterase